MSTNLDSAFVECRDVVLKPGEMLAKSGKFVEPTMDEVLKFEPTVLVLTLGAAMSLARQLNDTLKLTNKARAASAWEFLSEDDREEILGQKS